LLAHRYFPKIGISAMRLQMLDNSISECLLPGYHITELLGDGAVIALYRGYRHHDRQPVLIKLLRDDYRSPKYLDRLKREYEVLRRLSIPGIARTLDLEPTAQLPALVLEDCGAQLWKNLIAQRSAEITAHSVARFEWILEITLQVVAVLMQLHEQQLVHQQIYPSNILVNPENQQVQLLTAGLPDWFTKSWEQGTGIEESLWYMSPEQTGRMNQAVDYRTDFYSLGVTLYQSLAGELPFPTRDLNELVHCHVAQQPIALHERDGSIPRAISQVVIKLLQKMPHDRYQSAYGLQADLLTCLAAIRQGTDLTGTDLTDTDLTDFVPGTADVASELRIPQHLYGRQPELQMLHDAYAKACGGDRQLVLIAGESGVGKSLLAQSFQNQVQHQLGYFVVGKCDQVRREVPYLALTHAFQNLIRQVLTEPEAQIERWQQRLAAALEGNAQVLIDVLPELELILGRQPVVPRLATVEAQHRFTLVFQAFIRMFAQPEHPLILFLDDLQWIDAASLKLLQKVLIDIEPQALLLVVACRMDTHQFAIRDLPITDPVAICDIAAGGEGCHQILLKNFDLAGMSQLVADVVKKPVDQVEALATLLLHRTHGNPFFAHQLLEFLYNERLLSFNFAQGNWQWDFEQICQLGVTDNVVELMEKKIRKLPIETQHILKLAACFGEEFEVETLAALGNLPEATISQQLLAAIREGLVVPLKMGARIDWQPSFSAMSLGEQSIYFKFLHDRVRQAAYLLMPLQERQTLHLQVGKRSLQRMLQRRQEDQLFEVVNQLNLGKELMDNPSERQELAHLNLNAGRKAKMAAAYQAALTYFAAGVSLLPELAWEEDYQLTLTLWMEQAECQYLCGEFEAAELSFDEIRQHARTLLEQADVYKIQMACYLNQNRYREANQLGRSGLALLGIEVPSALTSQWLAQDLQTLERQFADYSPESLLALPTSQSPEAKRVMQLLQYLAAAAVTYDRDLYIWAIVKMTTLSLQWGNTDRSAYAYVAYGTILSASQGNYDWGQRLGQVALQLSNQFNALQGITQFSYGGLLAHWRITFAECRQHLQEAFQSCHNLGELLYVLYTEALSTDIALISGINLETVQQEVDRFRDFALQRQHPSMLRDAWVKQQFVRSLRGLTEDATSFSDGDLQEADLLTQLQPPQVPQSTISRYYIYKAESLYLFGYYEEAAQMITASSAIVDCHFGPAIVVEHYFFQSLILAALYEQADAATQTEYNQILQSNRQRLQDWATHCPPNFVARWHILEAELKRLQGDDPTDHYDAAIQNAQTQGADQLVAIANELAGQYYWKLGRQRIARSYLSDACIAYSHWGAIAKVMALQQRYRTLLSANHSYNSTLPRLLLEPLGVAPNALQTLDWMTVIKASQALSGEIVFSSLMEKLLTILIENAGAQRGVLLGRHSNGLWIEAEGFVQQGAVTAVITGAMPTAIDLPLSLITYVDRTRETVVLDQAMIDARFLTDVYIQSQQVKSAMCFPMFYQGKQTGILYLENRLISGAFTPAQLEILKLLTAQVTISIENARLYTNLQNYSQELEGKNQQLERSQTQLKAQAQQISKALQDLKQTQAQLVQTEKMSSLGQLVAGVAHEVKNPLNFIAGNIDYANRYVDQLFELLQLYQTMYPQPGPELETMLQAIELDFIRQDLPKLLQSMELGAERIQNIVVSLRNFSRVDEQDKQAVDIHEGIEGTLMILQPRFNATADRPAIRLLRKYEALPLVECYAGQLNQVVMNLIANSVDAIDEDCSKCSFDDNTANIKQITIATEQSDPDSVTIRIIDNGPGISEEIQRKIFEAFYTTKPIGKGTGLGLSISHQIVTEKHGGEIYCRSQPGHGSEFGIKIPVRQVGHELAIIGDLDDLG
jgi:predicted ATPase/signal transduction histidine kinase/serine/threonine protein kinase